MIKHPQRTEYPDQLVFSVAGIDPAPHGTPLG
jgi:hypothetical protein